MKAKSVRIIFNDDGSSRLHIKGRVVEFGDVRERVGAVRDGLKQMGYSVSVTPLEREGLDEFVKTISASKEDIVFNLCEGAFGKSMLEMNVAALLEMYGVKFTGSGSVTLGVALNKAWAKEILRGSGIPTARYAVMESVPVKLPGSLGFPLIVKPLSEDASIGIGEDSVVGTLGGLKERVSAILGEYEQPALVEEYIDGREFNISIIGNGRNTRALPPSEIDFTDYPEGLPRICSYESKWVETSPLYLKSPAICPASVEGSLKKHIETTAITAYRVLWCRDYARVDMRLSNDGELKVLEVNPNPDISMNAGFARAAKGEGIGYDRLLAEIVESALKRYV